MESGGQKGKLSRRYHPMSIPVSIERDLLCSSGRTWHYLTTLCRRKKTFLYLATAQPMRDCHNSANGKSLYFKFSVSSNGLFPYNSPSQLPLLFYEIVSFLLFSDLLQLHVPNCNSLLLPNKPIFAGKITGCFIDLGEQCVSELETFTLKNIIGRIGKKLMGSKD